MDALTTTKLAKFYMSDSSRRKEREEMDFNADEIIELDTDEETFELNNNDRYDSEFRVDDNCSDTIIIDENNSNNDVTVYELTDEGSIQDRNDAEDTNSKTDYEIQTGDIEYSDSSPQTVYTNRNAYELQELDGNLNDVTDIEYLDEEESILPIAVDCTGSIAFNTDKLQFICDFCFSAFSYKHELDVHKRTHTGFKPYECHVCLRIFHGNTKHQCQGYAMEQQPLFECDICPAMFISERTLMKHKKSHTFSCEYCTCIFDTYEDVTIHVRNVKHKGPFDCKVCDKSYLKLSSLIRHKERESHIGNQRERYVGRTKSEKTCKAATNSMSVGRRKSEKTPKDASHPCSLGRTKSEKTPKDAPYPCSVCKKTYRHKVSLRRHLIIHESEYCHQCEKCQQKFFKKVDLTAHELTHI